MNPTDFLMSIGTCFHNFELSHGLVMSLFVAGLVGGATHCVGMCGPFVLGQTHTIQKLRDAALLPYHLGRITTYIVLAVLLSTLLNVAFLYWPVRSYIIAPILVLAGVIFLVSAFPNVRSIFPWAGKTISFLPRNFYTRPLNGLMKNPSAIKRYVMGLLLGFMPCGLILSALMAAGTAPTPVLSGMAMAAFGLGTIPGLFALAYGGHGLKLKFPKVMQRVSQAMMVISAFWLFAIAGWLLI